MPVPVPVPAATARPADMLPVVPEVANQNIGRYTLTRTVQFGGQGCVKEAIEQGTGAPSARATPAPFSRPRPRPRIRAALAPALPRCGRFVARRCVRTRLLKIASRRR